MNLRPRSFDDKSYVILPLRERINSLTQDGKIKQTFCLDFNRVQTKYCDSADKMCLTVLGYKFLFNGKFECKQCNNYAVHGSQTYWKCICNHCASIFFSVLNLGQNVQAEFDMGIETPYKSITSVTKVTKKLLNNEKICAPFELDYFNYLDLFSMEGNITFYLTITTNNVADVAVPAPPQYSGYLLNKKVNNERDRSEMVQGQNITNSAVAENSELISTVQKMSLKGKRNLSLDINELSSDEIEKLLCIVRHCEPSLEHLDPDEVEIDFEKIQFSTITKMKDFVVSCRYPEENKLNVNEDIVYGTSDEDSSPNEEMSYFRW